MNLTTKFGVGSLVKMKYDQDPDSAGFNVLEIKEVIAQVCYGGTQVFYDCRTIVGKKEYKGFKKEGEFEWNVFHSISKEDNKTGWRRYREDELIEAPIEIVKVITKAE